MSMKAFFIIITLLTCTISYSQNQKFKAQVFIGDSSLVSGGVVIFPLTKDTLEIGNSDSAIIDLNNFENRVFYFLWSGWKSKVFRFDDNNYSDDFTKVYVPDTIFYRIYEEIHICPICLKSKNVIPIKYGMPTQRMLVQAKHKKIRLEGCLKTEEIAKFYCKVDDFEF